jgi:hypothetical protein
MNTDLNVRDQWERSTTRRLGRWLLSWRNLRLLLLCATVPVTLVALFYTVENWRGTRAWQHFKRQREAKGERFDAAAFVPPPVPEDQNFAMCPLLKPVLDIVPNVRPVTWRDPEGKERLMKMSAVLRDGQHRKNPVMGAYQRGTLTDLEPWREFYRGNTNYPQPPAPQSAAADVLTALGRFDRELGQLHEASARPYSRFPISYGDEDPFSILLPHLVPMKGLVTLLGLRAIARLENQQPAEALTDVLLAFRLAESIKDEPLLVSHLVRVAMVSINFQPVWEGLARHAWNDAQLAALEKRLAGLDFLAQYAHAMRSERAWGIAALEYYQRKGWQPNPFWINPEGGSDSQSQWEWLLRFLPAGWMRQNLIVISSLIEENALAAVDVPARRFHPSRAEGLGQDLEAKATGPYNFLAKILTPALSKVSQRTAQAQSGLDLCHLACALERYRLAQGQYPENLDALVPRFIERLPRDLISGEPLHYQRQADNTYLLYSVGWNRKDDGGQLAFHERPAQSTNSPVPDPLQGDWVWPCPTRNIGVRP